MSNVPAKIFRKSQPLCRMLHVLRETMRRDKNGKGASLIHAQTRPNAGSVVMQHSYSFGLRLPFYEGSDPNGIRTRVTAVKGRCPGPLDDRVKSRAISELLLMDAR
jgi:hypothetical protein